MVSINANDARVFKTWNFHLVDDPYSMIVDAIAIMVGNYDITRKLAANLILKVLLRDDFKKQLFENASIYPVDRGDSRVIAWKKKVLSIGHCERCGSEERLEAHHIIKWADYTLGRFDTANGECLCHSCHTQEHIGDQSYCMMAATN